MRILAIGDIHGRSDALEHLLNLVQPAQDDTVVTLGDYVDRGPDSRGVLDRLIDLSYRCRLIALRGNHDQMMLGARFDATALQQWKQVGGNATLASYGGFEGVPDKHWDFLENQCIDLWECETHFFVHGNAYPDVPLHAQPSYHLYWSRFDGAQPHMSGKIMVCGHTSQKSGYPKNLGFAICIDTWAYAGQWLSCLDVDTGIVYQADLDGDYRELKIEDCMA